MLPGGLLKTSTPPKGRGTAESAGSQSGDVSRLRDDHDEAGLTAGAWGIDSVTYADATAFRVRPGFVKKHFPGWRRSRGGLGKVTLRPGGSANIFNKGTRCYRSFLDLESLERRVRGPLCRLTGPCRSQPMPSPHPLPRDVRGDRRRKYATSAEGGPGHR